jgi:lipid A 3-O-deacylase
MILHYALGVLVLAAGIGSAAAQSHSSLESRSIWSEGNIGEGFRGGVQHIGLTLGGGFSTKGGNRAHDLVLATVRYGRMFGPVGEEHWYGGNWELGAELFGGAQVSPDTAYIMGGAPMVRYNFAPGSRWVPFVEAGFGFTTTDIKGRDLSTTVQFKSEAGLGVHYFVRPRTAITLQYHFFHLSNGGIKRPNGGVNINFFAIGLSRFF